MLYGVALVVFGFLLLVVQSALATATPALAYAPNLLLPITIYLGVSSDVSLVRGSVICFVLGYGYDAFCGSPIGLQTFVTVASFMVARGAGLRLFPQGPVFQILLTAVMAILSGGTILALRAIFERPGPFATSDAAQNLALMTRYAVSTALLSPLVFFGARRLEAYLGRGERSGTEGLL